MDTSQFLGLATILGGISMALIGVIMAAGGFLPDLSETAKRRIPQVIFGIVVVILGTTIIGTFANAVTPTGVILPLAIGF